MARRSKARPSTTRRKSVIGVATRRLLLVLGSALPARLRAGASRADAGAHAAMNFANGKRDSFRRGAETDTRGRACSPSGNPAIKLTSAGSGMGKELLEPLCRSRRNGRGRIEWSQQPAPNITELRAAAKEHGFVEFSPQDFQNMYGALFASDA
jgi:hypothetical protein